MKVVLVIKFSKYDLVYKKNILIFTIPNKIYYKIVS
jgi:hypothetical protein